MPPHYIVINYSSLYDIIAHKKLLVNRFSKNICEKLFNNVENIVVNNKI